MVGFGTKVASGLVAIGLLADTSAESALNDSAIAGEFGRRESLQGEIARSSQEQRSIELAKNANPRKVEQAQAYLAKAITAATMVDGGNYLRLAEGSLNLAKESKNFSVLELRQAAQQFVGEEHNIRPFTARTVVGALSELETQLNQILAKELGQLPRPQDNDKIKSLADTTGSKHIVMSSPQFVFNPKEGTSVESFGGLFSKARFMQDWTGLKRTYEALGATVSVIERSPEDSTRRSVFARDPVIALPNHKILLVPEGHGDDRMTREVATLKDFYLKKGYQIIPVAADLAGGNTVYDPNSSTLALGQISWDGHILPSSRRALAAVQEALGDRVKVIPIESQVIHVDWKLTLSPNGHAYFDTKTLGPNTQQDLAKVYGENVHPISDGPQAWIGLNGLFIGRAFVSPEPTPELIGEMAKTGYTVIGPQDIGAKVGSFDMLGGGPHCMTNEE